MADTGSQQAPPVTFGHFLGTLSTPDCQVLRWDWHVPQEGPPTLHVTGHVKHLPMDGGINLERVRRALDAYLPHGLHLRLALRQAVPATP